MVGPKDDNNMILHGYDLQKSLHNNTVAEKVIVTVIWRRYLRCSFSDLISAQIFVILRRINLEMKSVCPQGDCLLFSTPYMALRI